MEALVACGQKAIVVHQTNEEIDGVTFGKEKGLGNAQRGEVQYLQERKIPFYLYSIAEYEELVELARLKGTVPDETRRGLFDMREGLITAGTAVPTSANLKLG